MTLDDFTVTVDGADYFIKCIRQGKSWNDISYNFSTVVNGAELMLESNASNELIHDLSVIMGLNPEHELVNIMAVEIENEIKRKYHIVQD